MTKKEINRNLGVVVQARLGSTRLPKKVLKLINGKPLIVLICERIKSSISAPIVVATTTNKYDDELVEVLKENKIEFFRGSEDDVLSRFICTGEFFKFTDIIRVCSDNLFIDKEYIYRLYTEWMSDPGQDYLSYSYFGKPVIKTHFGIFCEIANVAALKRLHANFSNETYAEHVTLGLYSNPDLFVVKFLEIGKLIEQYDGIRLTVDTELDYELVTELYLKFQESNFSEIGDFIIGESNLHSKMKNLIKDNLK